MSVSNVKNKTDFTLFLNMRKGKMSPMRFFIYGCKEKEKLEKLIQDRCGFLENAPTRRTISLAPVHKRTVKCEVFSINFIFDCCRKNKLLDLKQYRLDMNVEYAGIDPTLVLIGEKRWPSINLEENKNRSEVQKLNQLEPSDLVSDITKSSKKPVLGNKCSENLQIQNYSQSGAILKASSKSPGNTFVNKKSCISAQNTLHVNDEKIESMDLFSELEECDAFFTFRNAEDEDKNNERISNIENITLKSQMSNVSQKCAKGYSPLFKSNKPYYNVKRKINIECVGNNMDEEEGISQSKRSKCHSPGVFKKIYNNQVHSTNEQLQKEEYSRTNCKRLSQHFSNSQDNCRSKKIANNKSKAIKSRHYVCSFACEHNLSDRMEKSQTSYSSQMSNVSQKCAKGYSPLFKSNKPYYNVKRKINIECVGNNMDEEERINQPKRSKCHSPGVFKKIYNNQVHSTNEQLEKEEYSRTNCKRLSQHFSNSQDNCRSKKIANNKSKAIKSRHYVCSFACEHNLSGRMENSQTSHSSQRKCNNSSMLLIQNDSFSSSCDVSFDEFRASIVEHSSKCGDDAQNIGDFTRGYQRNKLPEQFDSDQEPCSSLNTTFCSVCEDGAIEQPASSVVYNCHVSPEDKCKQQFLDKRLSTIDSPTHLAEVINLDADNESVSLKRGNQSLNTEKTVNVGLQVISNPPENCNNCGEETGLSTEICSVGNNTNNFSNEILSLIKANLRQGTKRDYVPYHVLNSNIQYVISQMCQRSNLPGVTLYDIICGAILCQPLHNLMRENQHKIIVINNDQHTNCIEENIHNISSDKIIHHYNVEVNHGDQPHLTKKTNDKSNSIILPSDKCFLKSVHNQEKSENGLLYPIINQVSEKRDSYKDHTKSVSKYNEFSIREENDAFYTTNNHDFHKGNRKSVSKHSECSIHESYASYTTNNSSSKCTTITRGSKNASKSCDREEVSLPNNEFLGKQYLLSKIMSSADKDFQNSQCETLDSDASPVPVHVESVELILKDTLKDVSGDCEYHDLESMVTVDKCDDCSFLPHTGERERSSLIRNLQTDGKLTSSTVSKDNKINLNSSETKNLCGRKGENYSLSSVDSDQLNGDDCALQDDGSDSVSNIDNIHYQSCVGSQQSSYFTGISPDVDMIIPFKH